MIDYKKRSLIFSLLMLVTCSQFVYSDVEQPYEKEVFSETVKFFRKKEYRSAKKELLKIKKDNLSRTAQWKYYDHLGYCEGKLENYKAAIKNYKKCIKLYYSEERPYIKLYFLYKKIRDDESAFKIARQIIDLFPEDERGYIYAANYYKEKVYDYEAACRILKEGIEATEENSGIKLSLARSYSWMGFYEDMFTIANELLEEKQALSNRNLVEAHTSRGFYYYVRGMYLQATEQYEIALSTADRDYMKKYVYSSSFWPKLITGQYDNALEILETLDKLGGKESSLSVETLLAYVNLFFYTGDMDKAISYCEKALERSKDFKFSLQSARAYHMLVELYEYENDFAKRNEYIKNGLKFVEKELKKYPKSYHHKGVKASILINSDDKWDTAGALIDELLKERDHSGVIILKGNLEKKKGKLNKAIKWFEKARQAYPRGFEWQALLSLSETHRELGQYDLALQNCKDALAINPNNRFAKDEIKLIEKAKNKKNQDRK